MSLSRRPSSPSTPEFETNLRRERQLEGIAAAKARGAYHGRKPLVDSAEVQRLRSEEQLGATEIARRLGVGRAAVGVMSALNSKFPRQDWRAKWGN